MVNSEVITIIYSFSSIKFELQQNVRTLKFKKSEKHN